MASYSVRIEARPVGKTGGVTSHVNVEADSEFMARELAKQSFMRSYPSWRDYQISITELKKK